MDLSAWAGMLRAPRLGSDATPQPERLLKPRAVDSSLFLELLPIARPCWLSSRLAKSPLRPEG